jgi:hypothetical protein
MEKSRKSLMVKLDKLNDQTRKDNVVTFEQLGVDRLFVDESHMYKNLFVYTKMRNVAGIAQTEAQKSQDMFNKCQYLDEITGGKGVTFATGTPISNSMTELYTNMRYLQYNIPCRGWDWDSLMPGRQPLGKHRRRSNSREGYRCIIETRGQKYAIFRFLKHATVLLYIVWMSK